MQLNQKELIVEWLSRQIDNIESSRRTGEILMKFKGGKFIVLKNTDSVENLQELIKRQA